MKFDRIAALMLTAAFMSSVALLAFRQSDMVSAGIMIATSAVVLAPVLILAQRQTLRNRPWLALGAGSVIVGINFLENLLGPHRTFVTAFLGLSFAVQLLLLILMIWAGNRSTQNPRIK